MGDFIYWPKPVCDENIALDAWNLDENSLGKWHQMSYLV